MSRIARHTTLHCDYHVLRDSSPARPSHRTLCSFLGNALAILFCGLPGCIGGCNNPFGQFSFEHKDVKYHSTDQFDPETESRLEILEAPLTFVDPTGRKWTAPAGTLTDGASVPRWALPIVGRPDNKYVFRAAVVHDAYCQTSSKCTSQLRSRPCEETHRMFFNGCLASGAKRFDATMWWAAVRLGGPKWKDDGTIIENNLSSVSYTCLELILKANRAGNDPLPPDEIEGRIAKWEDIAEEVNRHEIQSLASLKRGDLDLSEQSLDHARRILDSNSALDRSSEPLFYALRGYLLKNYAMVMRDRNDYKKSSALLSEATHAFEHVLNSNQNDPNALNGMGSVGIVSADLDRLQGNFQSGREKLDRAEEYIQHALKIAPDYGFAKADLVVVSDLRKLIDKNLMNANKSTP